MISEELIKKLKNSMETYKNYLLNPVNEVTEDDKKLFGIMMFKYGTLLAAKNDYPKMNNEEKIEVDLIIADAEAFIEVVNEICIVA